MSVATRVRRRSQSAIPPPPIRARSGPIRHLCLSVGRRRFPIGPNVEGDTSWELTIDGTATITIPIRSPDGSLLDVLSDESLLQQRGVRMTNAGIVYVVTSVASDDTGLVTLTFEDEVSWELRRHRRFVAADRRTTTRAGFIRRLCDEAKVRSFIPEVGDRQPVARATAQ